MEPTIKVTMSRLLVTRTPLALLVVGMGQFIIRILINICVLSVARLLIILIVANRSSLNCSVFDVSVIFFLLGILKNNLSLLVAGNVPNFKVLSPLILRTLDIVGQSPQILLVVAVGVFLLVTLSPVVTLLIPNLTVFRSGIFLVSASLISQRLFMTS